MKKAYRLIVGVAAVFVATGCYHATIETGLPAGSQMVSNNWAHGWLWGLVPPSTVNTAKGCPNGVAKVETQHSFLNMLGSFITWSLWTPMQIDVTCASSNRMSSAAGPGSADLVVRARDGSLQAATDALSQAAALAVAKSVSVYVVF